MLKRKTSADKAAVGGLAAAWTLKAVSLLVNNRSDDTVCDVGSRSRHEVVLDWSHLSVQNYNVNKI